MKPLLEVHHVSKTYRRGRKGRTEALQDLSFTLPRGCCLGIVGESGCGKSTLCRLITGLERPTSGQILYNGIPIPSKKLRGKIQMVFQNSLDSVNLHATAFQIISEPLENFTSMTRTQRQAEVGRLMELVGLPAEDMWKYPQQFSGGQLQRICIARALAAKPELLILDEPLSSLDVSVQAQLLNLLAELKQSLNLTCILISHDLEAVYYLSDALLILYGGQIMEEIDRIDDFSALCHPYTRRLLAAHGMAASDQTQAAESLHPQTSGCSYAQRCFLSDTSCAACVPPLRSISPSHRMACPKVNA